MLAEQAEQAAAEVLAEVSVPAARRATQARQATQAQTVTTRTALAAQEARQALAVAQPGSTSVVCPMSASRTMELCKEAQRNGIQHP